MPLADRLRRAELVRRHEVLTVDDSCMADVLLDRSTRGPPWGSLHPDSRVFTA